MGKIKILFLQTKLVCGGAEQALHDLISLLDKTKFDISILAYIGGGEWETKFVETGVPVKSIFVPRKKDTGPIGFIKHQFAKAKTVFWLKKNPSRVVSALFSDKFDIIVSYSSIWEYNEIGFDLNAKSVLFIHGDIGNNDIFRETVFRIQSILPKFHRIICVSNQAYGSFCRITGLSENVECRYNPVNSHRVRQLADEPVVLPEDLPLVCAVGRLAKEKAYDRLIRIHRQILDMGVPHRLVIVGDGPEREHLQQVIRETDTHDSVVLTGYQANPYPYMKKSAFLVCASYTEGLPVIVMEALSLGVPVVSGLPSIGEVFGDQMCGLLTANDDESILRGIYQMLSDPETYHQAKTGARKRSAFLDGNSMVKEMETFFEELARQ